MDIQSSDLQSGLSEHADDNTFFEGEKPFQQYNFQSLQKEQI